MIFQIIVVILLAIAVIVAIPIIVGACLIGLIIFFLFVILEGLIHK